MIVVSEARQHIRNGATFYKMVNDMLKRNNVIYGLKYGGRDGFEIPTSTGRRLEKTGTLPEIWEWTA